MQVVHAWEVQHAAMPLPSDAAAASEAAAKSPTPPSSPSRTPASPPPAVAAPVESDSGVPYSDEGQASDDALAEKESKLVVGMRGGEGERWKF